MFELGTGESAAAGDHRGDDGVEPGAGAAEFDDAGDGPVEDGLEAGEGDEEVVEAHDGVDLVADGEDVGGDFGVEEGAGDDVEAELHHLVGDVDGLVGGPAGGGFGGAGDDLAGVGIDAVAVEGRGNDAALLDVDGVVGGDEAFAEQDLHAAEGSLADEAGGLGDEDLVDPVGVVDEDDGGAEEAVVGDVAEGFVEVLEEGDGFAEADPAAAGVVGEGALEAGGKTPLAEGAGGDVVVVLFEVAHGVSREGKGKGKSKAKAKAKALTQRARREPRFATEKGQRQGKKQIPGGNDRKKGKDNCNGKGKGKGKSNGDGNYRDLPGWGGQGSWWEGAGWLRRSRTMARMRSAMAGMGASSGMTTTRW